MKDLTRAERSEINKGKTYKERYDNMVKKSRRAIDYKLLDLRKLVWMAREERKDSKHLDDGELGLEALTRLLASAGEKLDHILIFRDCVHREYFWKTDAQYAIFTYAPWEHGKDVQYWLSPSMSMEPTVRKGFRKYRSEMLQKPTNDEHMEKVYQAQLESILRVRNNVGRCVVLTVTDLDFMPTLYPAEKGIVHPNAIHTLYSVGGRYYTNGELIYSTYRRSWLTTYEEMVEAGARTHDGLTLLAEKLTREVKIASYDVAYLLRVMHTLDVLYNHYRGIVRSICRAIRARLKDHPEGKYVDLYNGVNAPVILQVCSGLRVYKGLPVSSMRNVEKLNIKAVEEAIRSKNIIAHMPRFWLRAQCTGYRKQPGDWVVKEWKQAVKKATIWDAPEFKRIYNVFNIEGSKFKLKKT